MKPLIPRAARLVAAGLSAAAFSTFAPSPAVVASASCESLAASLGSVSTDVVAQLVAAGAFVIPGSGQPSAAQAQALRALPAFCRVTATLRPTPDSEIKMELWMPAAGWNGKFQAVGNGGWSGSIVYTALITALARGYATSSTDTGHSGSSASFALGHPEKLIDFGYRAVHEMTVTSKKLVDRFYGGAAKHSYWNGCSAGGRQGLKEAQRFPGDFDGIVAGAPAADWTGRAAAALRIAQAVHRSAESNIPPAKYAIVHAAVLQACDALDGVADGVLENPRRCKFDPQVLACKGGDDAACLTAPQVEAAREIYRTALNPETKRENTALEAGSEAGWATWGGAQPLGIAYDHFRYVVFEDPRWDFHALDFAKDIVRAETVDRDTINALDPNLSTFLGRGGKLLQYHGWSDPQISPGNSVQYYGRVVERMGGAAKIDNSYRLFMVPGMGHCSGGEGPNTFDAVGALEQWVEAGRAPDVIVASRVRNGAVDRTRPLCPYPQVAVYKGSGSTDEAANFSCRKPGT